MKKLLPVVLVALGISAGLGAGLALRPSTDEVSSKPESNDTDQASEEKHDTLGVKEYVKLNNQFVIPMLHHDAVSGLVVMSLGLEVDAGLTETVFTREPKLRDALLQVLFDHANMGGFQGAFTDSNKLDGLRTVLTNEAQRIVGDGVSEVLIVDINRQEI